MKTSYLQKNNRLNRKYRRNQILVVVVLLVMLFFGATHIRGLVNLVNVPISITKNAIASSFESIDGFFRSKNELLKNNSELEKENRRLKIELLTTEILREENRSLKRILEYNEVPNKRKVSKVLNEVILSPTDTLVIDLGKSEVYVGAEVFYLNVAIGIIEEVYKLSSLVRLYSSTDSSIPVLIASEHGVEAIGVGSGSFKISLPKDILIEEGYLVTHKGSVIGTVGATEVDSANNTFQNIYFNYPFKLSEIDWVEVQ